MAEAEADAEAEAEAEAIVKAEADDSVVATFYVALSAITSNPCIEDTV